MIQVTDVTKHFESFAALQNASLHVRKGTIYGLVGPNGAGKTTIINHINGVMRPESGTVCIGGEPIFENEKIKEKVLNISDDWFFFPTHSVRQMASFYRDMYPAFSTARYEALKEVFRLDEKKQIRKMSKGQKKIAEYIIFFQVNMEYSPRYMYAGSKKILNKFQNTENI